MASDSTRTSGTSATLNKSMLEPIDEEAEKEARDKAGWSPLRLKLDTIFQSSRFDMCLGLVIVSNIAVIIMETNHSAICVSEEDTVCENNTIFALNIVFLLIYSIEAGIRIWTYRFPRLFHDMGSMFDFLIVALGYVDVALALAPVDLDLPGFQVLRIFRVARLARAIRILRGIPELYAMVRGFFSAMSAMFWGFLIILLLLMMWAILAVETIHKTNYWEVEHQEDWCYDAFESVHWSMLIFFQTLVAGDAWGTCAVPIIRQKPEAFFIFAGALVCIQLGFTNLILAVIVEKAAQVREEDQAVIVEAKEKDRRKATFEVYEFCKSIDHNNDATVSLDELIRAYQEEGPLREALAKLDIDQADLRALFQYMDIDKTGYLSYEEFATCLARANSTDLRSQVLLVKLQLQDLSHCLKEHVRESMEVLGEHLLKRMEEMQTGPRLPVEVTSHPRESLDAEFARFRQKMNQEITLVMSRVLDPMASVDMHHPPSLKPGGQFKSHYWSKAANGGPEDGGLKDDEWHRPEAGWSIAGRKDPLCNNAREGCGPTSPTPTAAPAGLQGSDRPPPHSAANAGARDVPTMTL